MGAVPFSQVYVNRETICYRWSQPYCLFNRIYMYKTPSSLALLLLHFGTGIYTHIVIYRSMWIFLLAILQSVSFGNIRQLRPIGKTRFSCRLDDVLLKPPHPSSHPHLTLTPPSHHHPTPSTHPLAIFFFSYFICFFLFFFLFLLLFFFCFCFYFFLLFFLSLSKDDASFPLGGRTNCRSFSKC